MGSVTDITSGLYASHTLIDSTVIIWNYAKASSTTVSSGGILKVNPYGRASATKIYSSGLLDVSDAGITAFNYVYSGGSFSLRGSAVNTTVGAMGSFDVFVSGSAGTTIVETNGSMYVGLSGRANATELYGTMSACGSVYSTFIGSGGNLKIESGGIASRTSAAGGTLQVGWSGYASDTTVYSSGRMYVSGASGKSAAASNTLISSGSMYVSDGGYVFSTTVSAAGTAYICTGGSADILNLESGGSAEIYDGASGSRINVSSGGRLAVDGGGATCVNISSGGRMFISSGGMVDSTAISSGGTVYVSGGSLNGGTVDGGFLFVLNGGSAVSGVSVSGTSDGYGFITISSGAYAGNAMVGFYGIMNVSSGGIAESARIGSGAWAGVYNGGSMVGAVISSAGSMTVINGGLASNTTVNGGSLFDSTNFVISSGGTANDTTVNSGGKMAVESGGFAYGLTVNSGGSLTVSGSGAATAISVSSGARLEIFLDSGTLVNGSINGVSFSGAGGMIRDITLIRDCFLEIASGGSTSNVVAEGGGVTVLNNGIAETTVLNHTGWLVVSSGGTATGITVNSECRMRVSDGGMATSNIVYSRGSLTIESGGTAASTTVTSGGNVYVSGGKLTGSLDIASGGTVSAYSGSIIDFDISRRTADSPALVNDLSLIRGTPDYTITVAATQANGTYTLSGGASGFTGTFSIGTDGADYGSITVNGAALTYGSSSYALATSGSNLVLTVSDPSAAELSLTVAGEFATAQYGDRLTGYTDGSFKLKSFWDGTENTIGTLDPVKWEILDSIDFDGDGLLELAVQDKTTNNVYLADDLASGISEAKLLGGTCLGMLGEGYSYYGAGHFDGKTWDNDILLKGPAFGDPSVSVNYGLPVWVNHENVKMYDGWLGALVNTWQPGKVLDGDPGNPADINAKNYQYDIVGIGDFNGDGRDDVMLQNTMPSVVDTVPITGAGDVFVFLTGDEEAVQTGAPPTVSYSGKVDAVNITGWSIAGVGDFNSDGIDDVLLLNQADGGLACWIMNNGQMQDSTWIGLKPGDREIAGIWDVNADGTDDVVLSTGTGYEAWTISSGTYLGTQLLA